MSGCRSIRRGKPPRYIYTCDTVITAGDIILNSNARAVADLSEGFILATVEIAAPPERVFRALASKEVCEWWVRPGDFDTREWTGDVRIGGQWRGSGIGNGRPFVLLGHFL